MLVCIGTRRHTTQCVMWPLFVVTDHPAAGDLSDLLKIPEQMQIQNLIATGAVEAFNVGILIGLAGLDVLNVQTMLFTPGCKVRTQKFRGCKLFCVNGQFILWSAPGLQTVG